MEIRCYDSQLTPDEYAMLTMGEKEELNELLNKVRNAQDGQCDRLGILELREYARGRFAQKKDKTTTQQDIMGWL